MAHEVGINTKMEYIVNSNRNIHLSVVCQDGTTMAVAEMIGFWFVNEQQAARRSARRIVACVNALEGLTTEQIEDGAFQKMRDNRDFLAAEVDRLREEVEDLGRQLMDANDRG